MKRRINTVSFIYSQLTFYADSPGRELSDAECIVGRRAMASPIADPAATKHDRPRTL